MNDATSRESFGEVIDLTRLIRPDADAFRHIAEILGARYAGDKAAPPEGEGASPIPFEPARARPRHDASAAALLETLPLPILVTAREGVAFLNRAARATLGYETVDQLEAAGGLAALVGGRPAADGAMPVADAFGRQIEAKVEMTPVDWAGERAVLVSLQTVPARTEASGPMARDGAAALRNLLSANPDPIAIVSRGGRVEAANAAYESFAGDAEDLRLEERCDAEALELILIAAGEAFARPGGLARAAAPVDFGGLVMEVSAGVVPDTDLACLVFHPAPAAPAAEGRRTASRHAFALERAVEAAERLLGEQAVAIAVSGGEAPALEAELAEESERFFRAVLLAIGARAPAGARLSVTRRGVNYHLSMEPATAGVLDEIGRSSRLVLFALQAGLALAAAPGVLTIAPIVAR